MQKFTIDNQTIVRILSVITTFIILLMVAFLVRRELAWIGAAFFLAVALNPAVSFFAKRFPHRSRGLATSAVFLMIVAIIGFLAYSLVPPLVTQSEGLIKTAPAYVQQAEQSNTGVGRLSSKYHLVGRLRDEEAKVFNHAGGAGSSVLNVLRSAFSGLIAIFTVLAVTLFMLLEGPGWIARFWELQPPTRRKRYQSLAQAMYGAMTGYVTGNLLTSLLATALVALLLAILGVPYAIPLGLVVGLLDLLPLIGATLAAVIVVVVALFKSVTAGVIMIVFFLIYQQLENHIVQPLVYGRTVQISPLIVTISIIIGAALAGILGAFVAIPIAASVKILIDDYIKHNVKPSA